MRPQGLAIALSMSRDDGAQADARKSRRAACIPNGSDGRRGVPLGRSIALLLRRKPAEPRGV
jgi:hypothetical protein